MRADSGSLCESPLTLTWTDLLFVVLSRFLPCQCNTPWFPRNRLNACFSFINRLIINSYSPFSTFWFSTLQHSPPYGPAWQRQRKCNWALYAHCSLRGPRSGCEPPSSRRGDASGSPWVDVAALDVTTTHASSGGDVRVGASCAKSEVATDNEFAVGEAEIGGDRDGVQVSPSVTALESEQARAMQWGVAVLEEFCS
jgi:hypothetical protein